MMMMTGTAVLAAVATGTTRIHGVANQRVKECNRIQVRAASSLICCRMCLPVVMFVLWAVWCLMCVV